VRTIHRFRFLAVMLGAVLALAPSALARPVRHAHAVTGKLYPVGVHASRHSASAQALAAAASGPGSGYIRGARPIPRSSSSTAAPLTATRPAAGSDTLAAGTASGTLQANFNGVSSRDSAVTNFNAEFEPPDQGMCVGNGYVVEMVNSAYTVYKPNGTVVTGPFNVNGPFDEGLREFTSDPRCQYDAATHTWFATILFINPPVSRVDLAVNQSGDPTGPWTDYQIDTTDNGGSTGPKHPGCPCLGDQPTLGIDASNVYITTNEFSLLGPQYNGAQIYAIAKSDLTDQPVPTATPAHFVHFDKLNIGGAVASSVQPALTTGNAPAEYFLNSLDPNGTFDQRVGVWAMTNRGAVATGGKPTLSSMVLGSEAYGIPPASDQKGSSSQIDSGDDRMQQTQSIGGEVYGELTTSVTIPSDPSARAGAAWFDVHPSLSGGVLSAAKMRRQGYVTLSGNDVIYPALQVTPSGHAAMVMTLTGTAHFPSAAYSLLEPGATAFGPIHVAAAGTGSYDPNATRWGDYSWAVLDPSLTSVWMATEYIPPKASQTPDGARNWGTRVMEVSTG
jgi:hypothetical protein